MPFSCRSTLTRKRAIVAERVGEIRAVARLEAVERLARHDLVDRLAHEVGAEALGAQGGELAVLADARRVARHEVQVGAVALQDLLEVLVDLRQGAPRYSSVSNRGSRLRSTTYFENSFLSVA